MQDLRERNLAAFFALLAGIDGVSAASRNPDDPLEPAALPGLTQLDGGHRIIEAEHGDDMYAVDVDVEIFVGGANIAAAVTEMNLLWGRLVKTAFDNRDLGGLAQDVRHTGLSEPEPDRSEDVGPYVVAVASFEIWFATAYGDPFTQP
ncbi:MAG: hypothetical protein Kow00114_35980 [Kiloniellaceae bacterium]